MNIGVETITPDMARDILAVSSEHFRNRPINTRGITKGATAYANAMRQGLWNAENGETIKFDSDGILIDGWHRLEAVKMAGKPIQFLVVRGLQRNAFETIDVGTPRTLSDILYSDGCIRKYPKVISAGAKKIITYIIKGHLGNESLREHTPENCKKIILQHPLIEDAARHYSNASRRTVISQANFIATFVAVNEADQEKGAEFIKAIVYGENLKKNNPCLLLREQLTKLRISKKASVISQYHEGALVIKAWNYFYVGRRCGILRWGKEEAYPKFYGWNPTL